MGTFKPCLPSAVMGPVLYQDPTWSSVATLAEGRASNSAPDDEAARGEVLFENPSAAFLNLPTPHEDANEADDARRGTLPDELARRAAELIASRPPRSSGVFAEMGDVLGRAASRRGTRDARVRYQMAGTKDDVVGGAAGSTDRYATLCVEGNAFYEKGDMQRALVCYDKAIALRPDETRARFNKGKALQALQNWSGALGCFRAVAEQDDADAEAREGMATCLVQLKKYEEAITAANEALALDQSLFEAWLRKGMAKQMLGFHSEALAAFEHALEIEPRHLWALHGKVASLLALGRRDEVRDVMLQAEEVQPGYIKSAMRFVKEGGTARDPMIFERIRREEWPHAMMVQRATSLIQEGKFEEAVCVADELVAKNPDDPAGLFLKGNALVSLGRDAEALPIFDRLLSIEPKHVFALYLRGYSFLMLGRHEEARVSLEQALSVDPRCADAWHILGRVDVELGQRDAARAAFAKAAELAPAQYAADGREFLAGDDASVHAAAEPSADEPIEHEQNDAAVLVRRGDTLVAPEQAEEAERAYRRAIEIDPQCAPAWRGLGDVRACLEKHEEAVAVYRRAIEIDPQDEVAWNHLGCILMLLHRDEEAVAAFTKLTEINPRNAPAWDAIALLNRQMGRLEEAEFADAKAAELDPERFGADGSMRPETPSTSVGAPKAEAPEIVSLLTSARDYLNHGDAEKALGIYDRVMAMEPNNSVAPYLKIQALRLLGRDAEAAALEEALKRDPRSATGFFLKAIALRDEGRMEEAHAMIQKANELDPGRFRLLREEDLAGAPAAAGGTQGAPTAPVSLEDTARAEVLVEKARALLTEGKADQAVSKLNEALKLNPRDALALACKGYALLHLGRIEEAAKFSKQAREIDPTVIDAWVNEGVALGQLGRHEAALDAFDGALKIDPKHAPAWFQKAVVLGDAAMFARAAAAAIHGYRIDPSESGALLSAAEYLLEIGKPRSAVVLLSRVAERVPDSAFYWITLANARMALDGFVGAHEAIVRARELDREAVADVVDLWPIYRIVLNGGRKEIAPAHFIRSDPSYAEMLREAGRAYARNGRLLAAKRFFEKLIAIAPHDADSRVTMGIAYSEAGRFDEAMQAMDTAIRIDPTSAHAWGNRGTVLAHMGRSEEALESLFKAHELAPDDPHALIVAAFLLHDAGRTAEALGLLGTLLELHPEDDELFMDVAAKTAMVLKTMGHEEDAQAATQAAAQLVVGDRAAVRQRITELLKRHGKALER